MRRNSRHLFDHLVGRGEQRGWNGQAERSGGLQIDYQLKPSDDQLQHVMDLAAPLTRDQCVAYLQAFANAIGGREIGDGELHRVAAKLQRELMPPPARAMDGTR